MSSDVRMKNRVGPWVAGDDFFDRDHERRRLSQLLREGAHVSLVAQRRTGKTSLLRKVAAELGDELCCLYVDLQDARDAADAVVAIALATRERQQLWTRTRNSFANVLQGVEGVGVDVLSLQLREGVLGGWSARGDRVLADLARGEPPVALLLDELPVLLVKLLRRDPAEAEAFLSWLRRGCLAHHGKLSVVVTGSIGLAPVAHRAGLSGTLNHYTPMLLEPWAGPTAVACLGRLAAGARLTLADGVADAVVAQLGCCIPYHVQLFFQLLDEDARRAGRSRVDLADVERVYRTRMLSSHGHAELAHMEERLRQVVPHEQHALVTDLLTEAAVTGALGHQGALALAVDAGLSRADAPAVLRDLLGVLQHDGYLERRGDDYRFVSKLLRDWWHARFSAFFVPVAER